MKNNLNDNVVLLFVAISQCITFQHCYSTETNNTVMWNYTIAVLLPTIEEFDFGPNMELKCGENINESSIQLLEAINFATDQITGTTGFLKNVNLSIVTKDCCGSSAICMIQTLALLKELCPPLEKHSETTFSPCVKNGTSSYLLGLIYPEYEIISDLHKILQNRQIPSISYSETRDTSIMKFQQLNHKDRLRHSFNTISSGVSLITEAILGIVSQTDWKRVVLHYSDKHNVLGFTEGYQHSLYTKTEQYCFIKISEVLETIPSPSYYENADAIICLCKDGDIIRLGNLLQQRNGTRNYTVLAGYESEVSEDLKSGWNMSKGSLYYVSPKRWHITKFDEYYSALTVQNNTRNSQFKQFWEHKFNCSFQLGNETENERTNTLAKCNDTEKLGDKSGRPYRQNTKVANILKSFYALAYGLKNALNNASFDDHTANFSHDLRYYINSVNFTFNDSEVKFLDNGFPNFEIYDIESIEPQNGVNLAIKVGEYENWIEDRELEFSVKITQFRSHGLFLHYKGAGKLNMTRKFPVSEINTTCSQYRFRCESGHAMIHTDACCLRCVPCSTKEYVSVMVNEPMNTECKKCDNYSISNAMKDGCVPMLPKYFDIQSAISMCSSLCLIISTIFVTWVFVKYSNTPAVKSTTKELSYIIFAGIIIANTTPFIPILSQNYIICAVRVIPPMSFTMIYGALLVKTNRIARLLAISKHKFPNTNPKFMSLKAQIVATFVLMGIEGIICSSSLLIHGRETHKIERNDNTVLEICDLNGMILIEMFTLIVALVLLCTYYAFKTRNLPENFNETKRIGFAMYATLLTEVAFISIYCTNNEYELIAVNLCVTIDSAIILIFLYSPKLYIILWKSEKNSRINFTTKSSVRSYMGREERASKRY